MVHKLPMCQIHAFPAGAIRTVGHLRRIEPKQQRTGRTPLQQRGAVSAISKMENGMKDSRHGRVKPSELRPQGLPVQNLAAEPDPVAYPGSASETKDGRTKFKSVRGG